MFGSGISGVIFLKFFVLGTIFGLIYEACKITKRISKNNIWIVNTLNFVYCAMFGTYFCAGVVNLCNGCVWWYTLAGSFLGLILEQISIGFLFTKFYDLLYNVFNKVCTKAKDTKLGNKLLR